MFVVTELTARMASAAGHRNPKCHVLNFFYDSDDGCALTVLVNEIRFHIIADAGRLRSKDEPESKLVREFRDLLRAVRHQDQNFTQPSPKENPRSSPIEGSQDSGHGTSPRDHDGHEDAEDDQDSAVDIAESKSKSKPSQYLIESQKDPEKALNDWMLQPFTTIFQEKAPPSETDNEQSLSQWYERLTHYYVLGLQNGKLTATEEDGTEDLEHRMANIVPKVNMPKYIRNLNIPWYNAKDVTVLDASDDPAPYRPSRVRVGGETYFLKVVDSTQPQFTKREIDIMKRIEKLNLHQQMHVPLVKGLVGYQDSHTDIIGFLQTEIEDPTPLTTLIDADVPQSKRDKWASESERIKNLLHDNNVVWGDAKADNFMVDKHDKLWIIDFGGSYTDGWIDPELMESREGDDMGVDKIVNALHDPEANTFDPTEDKTLYQEPSASPARRKRKAEDVSDDSKAVDNEWNEDAGKSVPRKRVRIAEPTEFTDTNEAEAQDADECEEYNEDDEDAQQTQYCFCGKPSSGDMVGCDDEKCEHQWFHFECVGLKGPPTSEHWYCDDCRS